MKNEKNLKCEKEEVVTRSKLYLSIVSFLFFNIVFGLIALFEFSIIIYICFLLFSFLLASTAIFFMKFFTYLKKVKNPTEFLSRSIYENLIIQFIKMKTRLLVYSKYVFKLSLEDPFLFIIVY